LNKKYDLVLLTLNFYPGTEATSKLLTDLIFFLSEKKLKILVISPNRLYLTPEKKLKNFEKINDNLDILRLRVPKLDKNKGFQKILLFYLFSKKIKKILKKTDYKIAFSLIPPFFTAYNALKISDKKKSKFLFLVHDLHPDTMIRRKQVKENSFIIKILKKQTHYLLKNSTKIIVIGRDQKEYISKNYNIESSKIEYIPNWSKDLYHKLKINKDIKTKYYKEGFNILYAGNIGEAQIPQLERFVLLMKKLEKLDDNINFIIVGNGRKKNRLLDLKRKNEINNIYFYDYVYNFEDYQNIMLYADCYFLPLRKESKGMSVPSKTYDYLSVGKPLISDIPIGSEIDLALKESGFGFNINNLSDDEAINKILKLKNDKNYYSLLSKNSRKTYENKYTLETSGNKYYDLIKSLL